MADLDRRLLPLIETLTEVDADWLVFEIMEGIRRGREPEESDELLKATREFVQRGELPVRETIETTLEPVEPIDGDDQIAWATEYVARRLDEALEDLSSSAQHLESIAAGSSRQSTGEDFAVSGPDQPAPIEIALSGDDGLPVTLANIGQAQEAMKKLREALAAWSIEAREQSS